MKRFSISRRDFIKTCIKTSALMGLPYGMHTKVAEAAEKAEKPSVVWLHFQECTGCSESLLRSSHPGLSELILDLLSLDYHETLMAGSGVQAEESLHSTVTENKDNYILVVEGAIPTKEDGVYCKVGGKTAIESLKEMAEKAAAIISIGTCASYGGIQAVEPNPTGAVGVWDIVKDKPVINVPGCPPNPYNFLSVILYYMTFNKFPKLDKLNRPLFAYGRKIHEHCERRPHFDAGRFAEKYGDEGHKKGYCLYKLGCKGPATFANCSVLRFNDAGVWPVSVGHPCIGCTEPSILFKKSIDEKVQIHNPTPPDTYPSTKPTERGKGADPVTTAVVGAVAGAAVGAGAVLAKRLPKGEDNEKED
ncbi:hydrogenase small subunit [Deferribacter thermophilus]|uniref:hydrogenase small subunit n=1 Tax=Deferribacter thermophilus TaxID=53573 RepID=UPI003C1C31F8